MSFNGPKLYLASAHKKPAGKGTGQSGRWLSHVASGPSKPFFKKIALFILRFIFSCHMWQLILKML